MCFCFVGAFLVRGSGPKVGMCDKISSVWCCGCCFVVWVFCRVGGFRFVCVSLGVWYRITLSRSDCCRMMSFGCGYYAVFLDSLLGGGVAVGSFTKKDLNIHPDFWSNFCKCVFFCVLCWCGFCFWFLSLCFCLLVLIVCGPAPLSACTLMSLSYLEWGLEAIRAKFFGFLMHVHGHGLQFGLISLVIRYLCSVCQFIEWCCCFFILVMGIEQHVCWVWIRFFFLGRFFSFIVWPQYLVLLSS